RRSSRIYFNDEGRVSYTDFGIEPGHAKGKYWVDYPDPVTGNRVREHFHEPADYDRFVAKIQANPELASAGGGGPIARTADTGVDAPAPPRALTPESTATTLSHEDRFAVRELANAIEELTEHRRMLGVMADQGASESLMTATKGWISDFEASSRSMVH